MLWKHLNFTRFLTSEPLTTSRSLLGAAHTAVCGCTAQLVALVRYMRYWIEERYNKFLTIRKYWDTIDYYIGSIFHLGVGSFIYDTYHIRSVTGSA